MQLTSVIPTQPPSPQGPVLADFNCVIRGARAMPRMGLIEARAWPTGPTPAGSSWDDAIRAAQLVASQPAEDGIHALPIHQAQGVLQAADGTYSITPLGGFHRAQDGPLFVDGRFFEATALSLQVTRRSAELVAVVGAERVLDLRHTGAATIVSTNANPPA